MFSVMVMFVILKVRLGSEEEHRDWNTREELTPMLQKTVKFVLGEEDLEPSDGKFIFDLLCEDAVMEAFRGGEMEKLATLIKQKRETFLTTDDKKDMLNLLKAVAEKTLGENHGMSDVKLNLLLEDKNIFDAAKAFKVNEEKTDEAAKMASGYNLWMLLGKAR